MMDGQKIFANDRKTLFGEQEMHVRHPAVQRIFYGNNCSLCLPFLHGINGILEGKARKRYAIGRISERGQMGIGTRSALISDGTHGFRGGLCRDRKSTRMNSSH